MTDAEHQDNFLIGDGSARLMRGYTEPESFVGQLMAADEPGPQIVVHDDIESYADYETEVRVETRAEIDSAFHAYKKDVYDIYGYIELKSSWMRGIPVKLEDLVFDDADKYLIDYLVDTVTDLYTWKQLAKLQACANMGVAYVRFVAVHDCPVCKSANGKITSVENLLRLLCRGGSLTHAVCPCDLVPVVYRETYSGPLTGHLDAPETKWGTCTVLNAPRELLTGSELKTLAEGLSQSTIEFVAMPTWCAEHGIDNSHGLVVYDDDDTLYVHNSYAGNATPVDYLRTYLTVSEVLDRLDAGTLRDAPAYWLDGQNVVKHAGHYYDAATGTRV